MDWRHWIHLCDCCLFVCLSQKLSIRKLIDDKKKAYICKVSGNSSTWVGNLKMHKSNHNGEMGHVCNYCGKSYIPTSSQKDMSWSTVVKSLMELHLASVSLVARVTQNIPILVIHVIVCQPSKFSQQYLLYYSMMTKNIIDKLNNGLHVLWYVRFEPRTFWTMKCEIRIQVPGLKTWITAEKK